MATYTKYNYKMPTGSYKDYMPGYNTYSYKKPGETFDPYQTAYGYDIRKAQLKLDELDKSKPAEYNSAYSGRINSVIDAMANRKFSYDVNGDALYQQYKDSYMKQGKQAMADVMGQAAAMTGGYGNSYASAVGAQAYQGYMDKLNDKIPELYQLAMDRYNLEGADLQNMYGILADRDSADYSKYRDTVADYQNERNYYDSRYQNLNAQAQSLWGQNWSNYLNVSQMNDANRQNAINTALSLLQQDWDNYHWAESQTAANYAQAVAEDQWNANFAENQRQFEISQDYQQQQLEISRDYQQQQLDYQQQQLDYQKDQSDYEKQAAKLASDQRIFAAKNNIVSPAEFYGSRQYSNWYNSYSDYVDKQLDRYTDLTEDEVLELQAYYDQLRRVYGK